MVYEEPAHKAFTDDVMKWAEQLYRAGIARGITDKEKWAIEFLTVLANELEYRIKIGYGLEIGIGNGRDA